MLNSVKSHGYCLEATLVGQCLIITVLQAEEAVDINGGPEGQKLLLMKQVGVYMSSKVSSASTN